MHATAPRPQKAWRAWLIWGVGIAAYILAVLDRTSFGVAGVAAASRFGASASLLSTFAILQLLMYVLLQIPAGVMLNRWGPRRLIVAGVLVMSIGQAMLTLDASLLVAVSGRALVGAGDAVIFVSVLQLVSGWFPSRQVPLLNQLTGISGQVGQLLSAIPFAILLHTQGWDLAFISAAALGALIAILALAVIVDPPSHTTLGHAKLRLVRAVVQGWQQPGTRTGFYAHFVTQFPGTVFTFIWGVPFLVEGEGRSFATASGLFSFFSIILLLSGPIVGMISQRHPQLRARMIYWVVAGNILCWSAIIGWPGEAPLWLLILATTVMAVGGPGSVLGYDFARAPCPENQGVAIAVVTTGGYIASIIAILLIGLVLDFNTRLDGSSPLSAFRFAMAIQYLLWTAGLIGFVRSRRSLGA